MDAVYAFEVFGSQVESFSNRRFCPCVVEVDDGNVMSKERQCFGKNLKFIDDLLDVVDLMNDEDIQARSREAILPLFVRPINLRHPFERSAQALFKGHGRAMVQIPNGFADVDDFIFSRERLAFFIGHKTVCLAEFFQNHIRR